MSEQNTDQRNSEEKRTKEVAFTVQPKIVVTPEGPTIKFQVTYRGRASVDVGFRLSWKGQLLDFQGPSLTLKAGTKPVDVSLRLPLNSSVRKGSKIKVAIAGPGGESLAVSSTGMLSVTTAGGKTFALGTKGVVISAALLGGGVVGAAALPWPPDPDPVVATAEEDEASGDSADDEPPEETTPPTSSTVVVEDGSLPVVVPGQITAALNTRPSDEYANLELFAFGQPGDLSVTFTSIGGDSESQLFEVAVANDGSTSTVGRVNLPVSIDPASQDLFEGNQSLTARASGLIERDTGTSYVCFDETTLEVFAGYRTTSDSGDLAVTIVPVVGNESITLAVEVSYSTRSQIELLPGASPSDIDEDRCPVTESDDTLSWTSLAQPQGGVAPVEDDDGSADESSDDSSGEASDDGGSGQADTVTYRPEPTFGSLELGDEGDRVEALQGALVAEGFYGGTVDGAFGPLTDVAVREFQSSAGLTVDGIAGPATHAALGLRYPTGETDGDEYQAEPATGPLQLRDQGERVELLQEGLVAFDLFDGPIDGKFGPVTQAAVRELQELLGLTADGVAAADIHEYLALDYS